jgi:hypothetical protein
VVYANEGGGGGGGAGGVVPSPLRDEELPGLEVLMCWHAYMLNPRCECFFWCVC